MQVSYDADFGPPMLQHLCRRKSLLMPSLTNEGHCMDACNHNETCLGVFLHKGRSILDKIDCYFNYDVCSIKDQTNFLKTDSPNDKLLWRRRRWNESAQ